MPLRPRGALAAALLSMGTGVAEADFPVGCVTEGIAYVDPIPGMPLNASSPSECQAFCAAQTNCTHFAFWETNGDCWLGGPTLNLSHRETRQSTVSGPAVCPEEPPACTETPDGSFPSTEAEDWPVTGYQPQALQCYAKDCPYAETLQSTTAGWTGRCKDLSEVSLSPGETCKDKCYADPHCPGYQVGTNGTCWLGIGWNCHTLDSWDPTWVPEAAGRIMRGQVRVLKELIGIQVPNLKMAFNQSEMDLLDNPSRSCAEVCYSVLSCEYWQLYDDGMGVSGGCWVDENGDVPYPLLGSDMYEGGAGWIAGEYIQRYCPDEAESLLEDGDEPFWIWALIALSTLACCALAGLCVYSIAMQNRQTKKRNVKQVKKRGLKPTPAAAPEPAVPQPATEPLMLYAVPVPVQTVSYAVPTYQTAAPMVVASQATPVATAMPAAVTSSVQMPLVAQTGGVAAATAPTPSQPFTMLGL